MGFLSFLRSGSVGGRSESSGDTRCPLIRRSKSTGYSPPPQPMSSPEAVSMPSPTRRTTKLPGRSRSSSNNNNWERKVTSNDYSGDRRPATGCYNSPASAVKKMANSGAGAVRISPVLNLRTSCHLHLPRAGSGGGGGGSRSGSCSSSATAGGGGAGGSSTSNRLFGIFSASVATK